YQLARASRAAARPVARAAAEVRSAAIRAMADGLTRHAERIAAANAADMARARADGLSAPLVDRLDLQGSRLAALVAAVREIAAQPDPVGQITTQWTRPNGLEVKKVRLPLGVVLMIYEARPNVTLDAAALCIRSGNAVILRGGSEAALTNAVLAEVVQEALAAHGLPSAAVQLVPTQAREAIDLLVRFDDCIDLVIPRGGEGLIRRVVERSRIPVVRHYKGVCHVYVHAAADLEMAAAIAENAKVQRPGVCNAMETLLVDEAVAAAFLPPLVGRLERLGVEVRGCERTREHAPSAKPATPQDWDTEFLGLTLAVRVVPDLEAAIAHIDAHGTQHSASIVSGDAEVIADFTRRVDASCVLVNASTRFNDGGELGLGAEMGISTTRVHAFGPMGAASLTAEKFVVLGQGQVRS
ncbi:MAG TPA: glutamate-5-semialdehyde dehydrogenase, partial [Myxococcota bacterium]|nr:glutamate-5-semialdehyde dehydrogenase [Myxococcota bacterium]